LQHKLVVMLSVLSLNRTMKKLIQDELPDWVRYIHTPLPNKDMLYSRSWAFNVAAQEAK